MSALVARPRRHLPKMRDIAAYHNVSSSTCCRCSTVARTERAHIIDRAGGGLDDVHNLVPLCYRCHRDQPPRIAGEERAALVWLAHPTESAYLLRFAEIVLAETDIASTDPEAIRRAMVATGLLVDEPRVAELVRSAETSAQARDAA